MPHIATHPVNPYPWSVMQKQNQVPLCVGRAICMVYIYGKYLFTLQYTYIVHSTAALTVISQLVKVVKFKLN